MLWLITALSIQPLLACKVPVPKDEKAPVYFPIEKGTKWVYKSNAGKDTRVITEVRNENGKYTVIVASEKDGKWSAEETVIITDKELSLAALGDESLDPPMCILKSPVKAGEKWNTSAKFSLFVVKTQFKVLDSKQVEVPAGRFQAVPVQRAFSLEWLPDKGFPVEPAKKSEIIIEWYAPNVGLVKRVIKGGSVESFGLMQVSNVT